MNTKKIMSIVLSFTMIFTAICIGVFAEETGITLNIGDGHKTLPEAMAEAGGSGKTEVTYNVYGKVTISTGSGYDVAGSATKVNFVGATEDAELFLDQTGQRLNPTSYITAMNADITFKDLIIRKSNGGSHAYDVGFLGVYWGVLSSKSVEYTGCTFPDGAATFAPSTKFAECSFENETSGEYNLWAYQAAYGAASDVIVENCVFTGARGIKMYHEGGTGSITAGTAPSLKLTGTVFTNITEKPAIAATTATSVEIADNTYGTTGIYYSECDCPVDGADLSKIVARANVDGDIVYFESTEDAETTGGTEIESAVAAVGNKNYFSLADALAAAETAAPDDSGAVTVTLLDDVYGGADLGANDPEQKTVITIDMNQKTWYAGTPTVGSEGTMTNAVRVLAGGTVTIKNGTINLDNDEGVCKIGIANYDTLTLEDVTIDAGENTALMVAINNRGTLELKGETTIPDGPALNVAITNDPYNGHASHYSNRNAVLTVSDENVVVGNILLETYGNDTNSGVPELNISAGTFGNVTDDGEGAIGVDISISGGKFDIVDISTEAETSTISVTGGEFKALSISSPENSDTNISDDITIMPDNATVIIGNTGYTSLSDAAEAADESATVVLLTDAVMDESEFEKLTEKHLILELDGHTLTASKVFDPRDLIEKPSGYTAKRTLSGDNYVYTIAKKAINISGAKSLAEKYDSSDTAISSEDTAADSSDAVTGTDSSDTAGSDEGEETPTVPTALPFTDVTEGDWFYSYVKYTYENNLMNGISETEFAPNLAMTRAMFVTILYRLAGSPEVTTDTTEWYSAARSWAMETGVSDGTNMNDEITREQLVTMLYRYAGIIGADTSATDDISAFTDADLVSDYASDSVKWAVANKLIIGMDDGSFAPQSSATRAQVAAIFTRAADILK